MQNNLKIMSVALVVVAGLAFWVSQNNQISIQTDTPLFNQWQDNDALVARIERVTLSQNGDQVVLDKVGEHWVLNEGFFADIEPLFTLIQSIKNARIVEAKTANPDNYARLDLGDDDLKVAVFDNESALAQFHVGKSTAGGLTFVRRVGEEQTYAVSGFETVVFNQDSWQLKTILDFESEDILSVKLSPSEGEPIEVIKSTTTGDLELQGIPAGYQLKESAFLGQLTNALSRFMIDDALPKNTDEMTQVLTGWYGLADGSEIKLTVFAQEDEYYVTVNAEKFSHYNNWMMKIPEYKFTSLNRSLSEYIEPVVIDADSTAVLESGTELE